MSCTQVEAGKETGIEELEMMDAPTLIREHPIRGEGHVDFLGLLEYRR